VSDVLELGLWGLAALYVEDASTPSDIHPERCELQYTPKCLAYFICRKRVGLNSLVLQHWHKPQMTVQSGVWW
jgi:hypothetical protein